MALLGAAFGVTAFGVYKVHKTVKRVKEELKQQELEEQLEEAKKLVEEPKEVIELNGEEKELADFEAEQEANKLNGLPYFEEGEDGKFHEYQVIDGIVQETPDSILAYNVEEIEDEEEQAYFTDAQGLIYENKEDLGIMRYPATSPEAMDQYRNFITADLIEFPMQQAIMKNQLFDILYTPTREYDENAVEEMQNRRAEFFGEDATPELINNVSVAEIMIYYAEQLNWNYDWPVEEVIRVMAPSINTYDSFADALNNNELLQDNQWGLFKLDYDYKARYMDDKEFGLFSQMNNIDTEKWEKMIGFTD